MVCLLGFVLGLWQGHVEPVLFSAQSVHCGDGPLGWERGSFFFG